MVVITDCRFCRFHLAEPIKDLNGYYICGHCSRVFPDDTNPEPLTNKLIEAINGKERKTNQTIDLLTRNGQEYFNDHDSTPL